MKTTDSTGLIRAKSPRCCFSIYAAAVEDEYYPLARVYTDGMVTMSFEYDSQMVSGIHLIDDDTPNQCIKETHSSLTTVRSFTN